MAQFARPSVDTHVGGFTTQAGGGANLYQTIDEAIADDADYIRSALAPASAPYVTKLSSVEDPVSSSGHTIRYRYQKDSAGGAQIDLTVELRQGYTNEGAQGTLIASATHNNIGNGWTNGSFTLSGPQADSITDYADLYLRFVANQV